MTDRSRHISHQQSGDSTAHNDSNGFTRDFIHRRLSLAWLVRATGIGLSSASLGFVLLVGFIIERGGELTLLTRPLPMQLALALPYLIEVFTLGATAGAVLAWRYRYWSLPARIHHTLLVLLGLGFSWQLVTLGFLPI